MSAVTPNWDIIGHEWAVAHLSARLAAGRLRHAILFTGISSVGKTALAVRLAQAINCTGDAPPCLACRACDLIGRGIHPDLLILTPDGNTIKIEQVRDLQSALILRPVEARFRIALILDAHRLTDSAADALLKTLEEPPSTALLLLTAPLAESVRETIASRCQVIGLRPVPTAQVQAGLTARLGISPERAAQIAPLAAGRPGAAITLARQSADGPEEDSLLYSRLAAAPDLDELALLRDEMEERFGPLPLEGRALVRAMEIKVRLRRLGSLGIE